MTIKILKPGHCKHCGHKLTAADLATECEDAGWCIGRVAMRDDASSDDMLANDACRELAALADRWADRGTSARSISA
jgi:hypothetical protein